jgi:hypothetical protein
VEPEDEDPADEDPDDEDPDDEEPDEMDPEEMDTCDESPPQPVSAMASAPARSAAPWSAAVGSVDIEAPT